VSQELSDEGAEADADGEEEQEHDSTGGGGITSKRTRFDFDHVNILTRTHMRHTTFRPPCQILAGRIALYPPLANFLSDAINTSTSRRPVFEYLPSQGHSNWTYARIFAATTQPSSLRYNVFFLAPHLPFNFSRVIHTLYLGNLHERREALIMVNTHVYGPSSF
jgi:hypothetical protein